MTRHCDVASSKDIKTSLPALAKLAGGIGDHMVRSCGTIGGSIANNDPAACYPSAVLALGATVITNERSISAEDFFVGMFETALNENEIITEVKFPIPEKASYIKFPNPASRYAMVGVFMAKKVSGVTVAVTGAGENGVFRCGEIENALNSNFSTESLENIDILEVHKKCEIFEGTFIRNILRINNIVDNVNYVLITNPKMGNVQQSGQAIAADNSGEQMFYE